MVTSMEMRDALDAAEERVRRAESERDNWRAIARSRKDQRLMDQVMYLEAELEVARAAVLLEGDRAEKAELRVIGAERDLEDLQLYIDERIGSAIWNLEQCGQEQCNDVTRCWDKLLEVKEHIDKQLREPA